MKTYQELKEKAMSPESTKEDRIALVSWFERNSHEMNNGEDYPLEDGYSIKPIWKGVGEPDEDGDYLVYEIVDAEIR